MSYGSELMDDIRAESAYYEHRVEECLANGIWVTRDGREVPVREMTDSHLVNSLRMMLRGGSGCFEGMAGEATEMLARETVKRGLATWKE